jgi:hypothetical protein
MEGARGIEPPPRCSDEADGFEDRGVPSTIAPAEKMLRRIDQTAEDVT